MTSLQKIHLQNVRTQKWQAMLKQMSRKQFHNNPLVKKRVRKGIPIFIKSKVYEVLLEKPPQVDYEVVSQSLQEDIMKDIPRTFGIETPLKNMLQQTTRILRMIGLEFPKVGYVQGMNYWVYRVIEEVGFEAAWRVSYNLMTIPELRKCYQNMLNIQRLNHVLKRLVFKHLPNLHAKLQAEQINYIFFTPSLFLTIFAKNVSQKLFSRLLDCILYEGFKIFYRAILTLLKFKEEELMQCSREQLLIVLVREEGGLDVQKFMQQTFEWSLSRQQISQAQKQF